MQLMSLFVNFPTPFLAHCLFCCPLTKSSLHTTQPASRIFAFSHFRIFASAKSPWWTKPLQANFPAAVDWR